MHQVYYHQMQHKGTIFNGPLRIMLIVSGLFTFAFGMFSPIYALFVEELGGDVMVASNAWAVLSLAAGLFSFVTGKWENKIKETELGIAWSQFIIGFAYLIYFMADGVLALYAAQALLGIGLAFYWPAFHAVYGKHTTKAEAPWQWSVYDGLGYLLPAIAAVLGGELVKEYGFETIFIIMAGLSFLCGLFIMILPRKVL